MFVTVSVYGIVRETLNEPDQARVDDPGEQQDRALPQDGEPPLSSQGDNLRRKGDMSAF